jgi:ATP-dependent Clp protease ATP-binding subunit ClpA
LLTDGVDQHPHSVLLLDEIEKAHPDLFNVLLQIMDHGKLTDHNGKQVDFRNVVLIMTTNAGAADLAKQAYGFTRIKRQGDDVEAINRLFAPEFRNRLDSVITFSHLSQEVIAKVVEKFVMQLEAQLADRNVTIELTDEAREWLVEHGYDETMGARPMARLIQSTIKTPLADHVLFGPLKNGGAVRVIVEDKNGKKALGFEFPEGRVMPKPEKDVAEAKKAREKRRAAARKAAATRKVAKGKKGPPGGDGPAGGSGGGKPGGKPAVRTVPKVPLVRS